MVGIAPTSEAGERLLSKNPMIKYMLKQREMHAKNQDRDYSHVFRKRTRIEMYRLAAIAMAIEFAYAAETAFVSPILLQIGVDHKMMTMAWGLSPLLGFFLSPLLGSISDRCYLNIGRRRPIVTLLSFGVLLGLILVPYGKEFGMMLGDEGYVHNVTATLASNLSFGEGAVAALQAPESTGPSISNYKYATILTIIGLVLLDFDADTCQTPARTYLLDMCIPEDQPKALTMFTLFAGIGGTVGYGIGGIDWERTNIGSFLGGNIPTVFGIVTIIFVVCFFVTVTTFREIPLRLIEKDELLKPLSDAAIKKELSKCNSNIFYIEQTTSLENEMAGTGKNTVAESESYQNGNTSVEINDDLAKDGQIAMQDLSSKAIPDLEAIEEGEKPVSLSQYLRSIFVMPPSLRILALTNLFCWMGHVAYCLYFTDFVGEAVFHGSPTASPNSESGKLYEAGVRFGCLGMSIYAASCSVYSLSVTKLMKWLGPKVVYISGISYYGIGMLILGLWPTKWGVLVFSTSAGILYGTLFTMPYILIASYHAKNCFRMRKGENVPLKQTRGLGTDVAIISSVVFIAQLIISLCMGPIVDWMQTTCAILYVSTFLSVLAAISAMFVLYV